MEDIIQEKISADHLLYVSLKYTKTCDVILNLTLRWRRMIEISIDAILEHAKKKKKISTVATNPTKKIEDVRKLFKKDKNFQEVIDLYEMFRKIEDLRKEMKEVSKQQKYLWQTLEEVIEALKKK